MSFLRCLQTALGNLSSNKLRSALTMLGVIIGVGAVIVMVSIVEGARAQIVAEFERLGSQLILIAYQPERREREKATHRLDGLTMDDLHAIATQCDLIERVSPEFPMGEQPARYRDRETDVRPQGVGPEYGRLRDAPLARGRFINEDDLENWSKVCILGPKVARALFGKDDPLGAPVAIGGVNLTVVGVLVAKGRSLDNDADKVVLLPITTVQKRMAGRELVALIWAQPRDPALLEPAMDQVWQCLMRRHDNAPGFRVDSQQNILNSIGRVLTIFSLVLGSVAGLALLVGGIGIMNIMLVSVTERTREIGIRKAVGAKRRDILLQFLIEAATVSGTGGVIGIASGALAAWGVAALTVRLMPNGMGGQPGIPVHLPLWAVLGAFLFSALIGVFFGVYPAARAARMDPIQALRHE
jgi:putative ABC transport system permease protein